MEKDFDIERFFVGFTFMPRISGKGSVYPTLSA
jgi:hypothetical protein